MSGIWKKYVYSFLNKKLIIKSFLAIIIISTNFDICQYQVRSVITQQPTHFVNLRREARNMNLSTICIASQNWNNSPQNASVQLMIKLAQTAKVLFVNPQPTPKEVLTSAIYGNDGLGFRFSRSSQLTEVELENGCSVFVLHPRPGLPINWVRDSNTFDRWTRFNARRLTQDILAAMAQLAIDQPVVINALQPALGLALKGCLNERLLLYYCYKDLHTAGLSRRHDVRVESEFMSQVDAVITASKALLASKGTLAQHSYCITNGINFDLFYPVINLREKRRATHLLWKTRLKTPIRNVVGVIGPVGTQLDLDLLQCCFDSMPDTDFWFIGKIMDKAIEKTLMAWPTVWLLGQQDADILPELMAQLDVVIIPLLGTSVTKRIDPLYINEFLAAGLPVVATQFTDLSEFDNTIDITSDNNTFIQLLDNALAEPDYGLSFRVASAYENDWSRRTKKLISVIDKHLSELYPSTFTEAAFIE